MVAGQLDGVVRHVLTALALDADGATDGQLLERFLVQRDESAFAALVRRHAPMVWGVCRRVLGHHDAEDAFQATFLVLARKADSIRQRESVGSWLHGTAHRTALAARAARRRSREVQVGAMPEPERRETGNDPDLRDLLDEELNRLPDKYREAIVLCDLEGRTREDASRHAGLACGTLSGRLTTARRMLAERLARRGVAVSVGLLPTLLVREASAAVVPETLVTSAIATALGSASAPPVAVGLAEGVLKAMTPSKLTSARVALVALAVLGIGAAVLAVRVGPAEAEEPLKEGAPIFSPLPGADDKKPADPPAKEKAKEDKDRELHVVGLYEGYTKSNGQIHGGRAQVQVSRAGKKVTLVLVAYEPVTWEVAVNKNTTVEKVILGGSSKAAVKGLPEKVAVVEAFRGSKDAKLPFYAYKMESPNFRALVEALDAMTGQKLASFTGLYRADSQSVIAVEDVSDDERFSLDYPKPTPMPKLAKLTFQAHHEVPGKYPHEVTRSFGEFTLAGVKADTLQPLPDHVSRITYDPAGKKYYGIYRHKMAEIDLEKKKVKELDTGLDVPELSWPADVAFDAKRERVLLTTSGGGGYLYAYYPKTEKWEVLAEKPANTIVYHPKDEVVYGLKGDFGREGAPELQQINAKGAVVTRWDPLESTCRHASLSIL